jgi:hypothetical protein
VAIEQRVSNVGLRLGRTEGDGNCMPRAICAHVNSDRGVGHAVVRRQLVDFMRSNPASFAEFFPADDGRNDGSGHVS